MRRRIQFGKALKKGAAIGLVSALPFISGCATAKITKRAKIHLDREQPKNTLKIEPGRIADHLKITNPEERADFISRLNEALGKKGANRTLSIEEFEKLIKSITDEMEKERRWRERRRIPPENPVA